MAKSYRPSPFDQTWNGYAPTDDESRRCGGRKVAVITRRHIAADPLGRDLFNVEIPKTGAAMIRVRSPRSVAHRLAGEACCLHDLSGRCLTGDMLDRLKEDASGLKPGRVRKSVA